MQQVSLDQIKRINSSHQDKERDCLPDGVYYDDDDNSEPEYDPREDENSPYFRLADYDDYIPVTHAAQEATSKTLRGDVVDEDGWCTTDIPEGSLSVAGDVIERTVTEDPLSWSDDVCEDGDFDDENAPLPDFDDIRF